MAKYRILTTDELAGLEQDFIKFLVLNGVPAEDWVKMKANEPGKATEMVGLFSDVVFEKILRNVKFLEIYETKSVRSFKCGAEEIEMITMEVDNDTSNFKDPTYISNAMTNPPDDLLIYKTEKPYNSNREEELFQMIENGCLLSQGKLHQTLEMAVDAI